jgi:hypothetical protein
MNFQEALQSGATLVNWVRQNPNKANQLTVQFKQLITVPQTGTTSILVAKAQGIKNAGRNEVTALLSFDKETAIGMGLTIGEYHREDKVVLASDLFEGPVRIKVWEDFAQATYVDKTTGEVVTREQDPKRNPRTGAILCVGDKPIYRHTELCMDDVLVPVQMGDLSIPEGVDTSCVILTAEGNAFIKYDTLRVDPDWAIENAMAAVESAAA